MVERWASAGNCKGTQPPRYLTSPVPSPLSSPVSLPNCRGVEELVRIRAQATKQEKVMSPPQRVCLWCGLPPRTVPGSAPPWGLGLEGGQGRGPSWKGPPRGFQTLGKLALALPLLGHLFLKSCLAVRGKGHRFGSCPLVVPLPTVSLCQVTKLFFLVTLIISGIF